MLNNVVSRVNAAKCLSFLPNEIAGFFLWMEQILLCVRYIISSTLKRTEEFSQFISTNVITGKRITNLILLNLQQLCINTQYLRGQEYNWAAAMTGIC